MPAPVELDSFLESLPTSDELRSRLARNVEERALLRKILRLTEQKERALAKGRHSGE